VNGSASFEATAYSIQPGLALYTWLSQRARGWEKYRFRKFEVTYIPEAAVTTTTGSVYLAAEYNPSDQAPASLAALSTYETQSNGRTYEMVSLKFKHGVMFDGVQHKRIRCGPVAGDLGLYDAGKIIVASIGGPGSSVGQLWVHYEIELVSPQTSPSIPIPSSFSLFNLSANQAYTNMTPAVLQFDETIVDGIAPTLASGVFTLPCGMYELSGEITGNNSANESFTVLLELLKNGSSTSPPQKSQSQNTIVATGELCVPFHFYVYSDGDDTVSISVQLNGASGTLLVLADYSRIGLKVV